MQNDNTYRYLNVYPIHPHKYIVRSVIKTQRITISASKANYTHIHTHDSLVSGNGNTHEIGTHYLGSSDVITPCPIYTVLSVIEQHHLHTWQRDLFICSQNLIRYKIHAMSAGWATPSL